jgi:hypothetical protein
MIFKIFTAKRDEAEYAETGTYPDGYHMPELDMSARKRDRKLSAYERDYGRSREISGIPVGLA